MAARALRFGAVLQWSLSLMSETGLVAHAQDPELGSNSGQVVDDLQLEDEQDCDEEVNKSDPFHSCLCRRWEKTFKKRYPDVDYSACDALYNDKEAGDKFLIWYVQYKKNYTTDTEKKKRFSIFAANFVYMQFKNSTTNDYVLDANEFADLTPDEFRQTHLGLGSKAPQTEPSLGTFSESSAELPETVDYVESGAVNTPLNQGNAQSCWSFTAAASVEGGWQKRTGVLVQLSEQQFLDCTGNGMTAIAGGDLVTPIAVVAVNNDLCSRSSYPYTGKDGTCRDPSSCTVRVPQGAVTGFMKVKTNDEGALMTALYMSGPVSVGIAADGTQLMFYKSGVMTAPCGGTPNHAVNVVGYGRQGALPYWKLKNSWGPTWGEQGMFRLVRGKDGAGECSVKSMPAIPVFTDDQVILGMATTLGNQPHVVQDDNAALGDEDKAAGWTPSSWTEFKEKWLFNGELSWLLAVLIGVASCLFGCCCGSCFCGRKAKSRGVALMQDDEEDYYPTSSDDE